MTGLMSITGVPSIASSPSTVSRESYTLNTRQTVTPSRLGGLPRCAKMPVSGQSSRPRAWSAPRPIFFGHPVEQEDNFGMAERIRSGQRIGPDLCRVQLDRGSATSPIVVNRINPAAPHKSYGFYRERHAAFHRPHLLPRSVGGGEWDQLPGFDREMGKRHDSLWNEARQKIGYGTEVSDSSMPMSRRAPSFSGRVSNSRCRYRLVEVQVCERFAPDHLAAGGACE